MSKATETVGVRSVNRGVEASEQPVGRRAPALERLDAFIGRWITEGHTVGGAGPELTILASDVYEWAPGGFFVVHSAYGRIGEIDVGGVEIIGYDTPGQTYISQFFDSQGNVSVSTLTFHEGTWTWQGEGTRCKAQLSADGRVQTAHHERSDDGSTWQPSMEVALRKVE